MGPSGEDRRRAHDNDTDREILLNVNNKVNNAMALFLEFKQHQIKTLDDHEARIRESATKKELDDSVKDLVTKDQFSPIRLLVYGCSAILLAAVISSIIKGKVL